MQCVCVQVITCEESSDGSRVDGRLKSFIDACQEGEEKIVVCHRIDDARHGKATHQQTEHAEKTII